jgi:hypothetical protein
VSLSLQCPSHDVGRVLAAAVPGRLQDGPCLALGLCLARGRRNVSSNNGGSAIAMRLIRSGSLERVRQLSPDELLVGAAWLLVRVVRPRTHRGSTCGQVEYRSGCAALKSSPTKSSISCSPGSGAPSVRTCWRMFGLSCARSWNVAIWSPLVDWDSLCYRSSTDASPCGLMRTCSRLTISEMVCVSCSVRLPMVISSTTTGRF